MKLSEINIRDPFILPWNGKYYMYGSRVGVHSDEFCWGMQDGFDVYVSTDLIEWSAPKSVFELTPDFWGERDSWAPEVHEYKGKFYLFASFTAKGKHRGTHIFVCDTPDGTFVPVSPKPATPEDWECLDGTFYVDKEGKPYIIFCHEWLQIKDGTVCAVQLSDDLSTPVSAPRQLWKASDYANVKYVRSEGNYVTDGPFVYRNGADLLIIWSTFDKNGYTEVISKSDNGDINGNWSVLDTPLSSENGGHGMIFKAFDGTEYFIMHKPNGPTSAERPVIIPLHHDGDRIFL